MNEIQRQELDRAMQLTVEDIADAKQILYKAEDARLSAAQYVSELEAKLAALAETDATPDEGSTE